MANKCIPSIGLDGGEAYLGMLGDTGQPVPVTVKRAQERLGEHSLQLDSIQRPLILPLRLEWMQVWAGMLLLIQVLTQDKPLLIVSVQFVNVVFGLPDIVLGAPP